MAADFKREGDRCTLYVSEHDVFANTGKYENHRLYIADEFLKRDIVITHFHTTTINGVEYPGLKYMRADSEITTTMEITAILGVNARMRRDDERDLGVRKLTGKA